MITRNVTISNRLGLHARAATKLVQAASSHASQIMLVRDEKSVNAKSIMGVLMLAAGQGTKITVSAEGPDESAAVESICALIDEKFGEPE